MNKLVYDEQQASGNVRYVLQVLFKHQRKIMTVFFLTVICIAAITFISAPIYQATASLLVKIGREYRTKPDVGSSQNQMVLDREEIINSEIVILNNRELIENVVRSIGATNLYPQLSTSFSNVEILELAVVMFSKALNVKSVPKSNIISLTFEHHDPEIATKALNVLIDLFKEKHLEVFSDPESSSLEKQLNDYRQRLKLSENAVENFRQTNRIYSVGEQRNLLLEQQSTLDTSLMNVRTQIAELQQKAGSYRSQLDKASKNQTRYTQTERDRIVVDAQIKLLGLRLREQELLSKDYRNDSQAIDNVRKETQLVKNFLEVQENDINQKVRTGNPVYQELEKEMIKAEVELVSRREAARTYFNQLEEINSKIQSLDKKQNELHALEREFTINEKNYLTYQDKYEEARISADLNQQKIANISVVQTPITPQKPIKPRKALNLVLGILLGGISSIAIAFIAELISQGLSTPEQVTRRLGVPVLGSIKLKG